MNINEVSGTQNKAPVAVSKYISLSFQEVLRCI